MNSKSAESSVMPPKKLGTDVQTARGRLKGALQDMVKNDEDSLHDISAKIPSNVPPRGRPPKTWKAVPAATPTGPAQHHYIMKLYERHDDLVKYDISAKIPSNIPPRGRPPKNKKAAPAATPTGPAQHHFIIKLYERRVDLAKYEENTALYPVCRDWMMNQPGATKFKEKKPPHIESRNQLKGIVTDRNSVKETEIHSMPAMKKAHKMSRVPSPIFTLDKDKIDLDYDVDNPPMSRADLIAELKSRSIATRNKWQKQSVVYEEAKFADSLRVLEHIYKE